VHKLVVVTLSCSIIYVQMKKVGGGRGGGGGLTGRASICSPNKLLHKYFYL